jgi:hypothetical protein
VDAAEGDRPGAGGIRDALAADAKRRAGGGFAGLELTERDLPIGIVGAVIALAAVPIALLLAGLQARWAGARCCGAGLCAGGRADHRGGHRLYGRADRGFQQPGFGVGILTVLGISVLLLALHGTGAMPSRWWLSLFVTSMVLAWRPSPTTICKT